MILFDQAGAGAAGSRIIPPDLGLKHFVEHLWVESIPVTKTCQMPWRIVPDASAHLIVVVARGSRCLENIRRTFVGARSRFVDVSVANRSLTFGVRLLPGVLSLLTRLPASDLTDRSAVVDEFFGTAGRVLTAQLAEQQTAAQALTVLSDFLGRALRDERPNYEGLALAGHMGSVEDFAGALGVPCRTLYSRTLEQVGLAPKRVLRIQRLHRVLEIRRRRPMPWAHVACLCGFADQAHLVREFQELLGESPGAWQERARAADFYNTSPGAE
jgi:AraC-like DNA-binding protein